jgi:hypothetical protein
MASVGTSCMHRNESSWLAVVISMGKNQKPWLAFSLEQESRLQY